MSDSRDIEKQKKLDEAKRQTVKNANKYKRVFGSPEGQEVLKDLHMQFVFDYICGIAGDGLNTESILVRAAQRDVVEHINRNIRVAEEYFEDV